MNEPLTKTDMLAQLQLDAEALEGLGRAIDTAARNYARPPHHLNDWESHHTKSLQDLRQTEVETLGRLDQWYGQALKSGKPAPSGRGTGRIPAHEYLSRYRAGHGAQSR